MTNHCDLDPIDYDGPDRCITCGKGADRPFTCIRCAHERALECAADGDPRPVGNILRELLEVA